ncbi:MAG: hypothetical protein P4L85_23925 [Paludisphaera borealis]|uniref:hypothetical protein n=1 Tax=Paludisphaera borealis TaxID=1387353 RepID=UPI00284B6049|nr:hypothetical protein [Paludisphaera borealis]MDR3622420.1 hypothetical protein [Paludisphaera borealis]
MTGRQRMVFRLLPLLAAVPLFEAAAHGQAARVDPYQNGAAPAFPGRGVAAPAANATSAAAAQAAASGYANPMLVDPMAASYLYGTAIPMTRGQVGLSAVSSIQQFTGLGSGRISGVRGGAEAAPRAAAHTRNSNIVGGQASRYFNRIQPRGAAPVAPVATTAGAANSRKFYQRESRYFPQPAR